jgi:uncharacterized phage-like protein YoqJ
MSAIGDYNPNNPIRTQIKKRLLDGCEYLVDHCGTKEFMSGMALGIDQDAVNVVMCLQMVREKDVILHAAVPYPGQESKWPVKSQNDYTVMLSNIGLQTENDSDVIHYVHPNRPSSDWQAIRWLQDRNQYMVDWCDLLVAVWNGDMGGTRNCIEYAKKVKKPILLFRLPDSK